MNSVNAVRKLNEFKRWQNISGNFEINYDSNFFLELNCNSNPPYKCRDKLSINRECALEELNAIMYAVNCIELPHLRQLLILNYLISDKPKNYEVYSVMEKILNYLISDKPKNYEVYSVMEKSESWYYPKKKQALEEFSKYYRESCLVDS